MPDQAQNVTGSSTPAQPAPNAIDPFSVIGTDVVFQQVTDIGNGEVYLAKPRSIQQTKNQRCNTAVFNIQNGAYTQVLLTNQRLEIEFNAMNVHTLLNASLLIGFQQAAPATPVNNAGSIYVSFLAPLYHMIDNYQVMYGGSPYATFNAPWIVLTKARQLNAYEYDYKREIMNLEGSNPNTSAYTRLADELPAPILAYGGAATPHDTYSLENQYKVFGYKQEMPAMYGGGVFASGFIFQSDGTDCVFPQEIFNGAFIRTWAETYGAGPSTTTSGAITRYGTIEFKDFWCDEAIWWPLAGQRFKLAIQTTTAVNTFPMNASTITVNKIANGKSVAGTITRTAYAAPLASDNFNYAQVVDATMVGDTVTILAASQLTIVYMQLWFFGLQIDNPKSEKINAIYLGNTIKTRHVAPRYLEFPLTNLTAGVKTTQVLQGLQGTFAEVSCSFVYRCTDNLRYNAVGCNYNTCTNQSVMTDMTLNDPGGSPVGVPNTPGILFPSLWGPLCSPNSMFGHLFRSYTFAFSPNITSAHMNGEAQGQLYMNGLWSVNYTPFRTPATTRAGVLFGTTTAAGSYNGVMLVTASEYAYLSQYPSGNWIWRPI